MIDKISPVEGPLAEPHPPCSAPAPINPQPFGTGRNTPIFQAQSNIRVRLKLSGRDVALRRPRPRSAGATNATFRLIPLNFVPSAGRGRGHRSAMSLPLTVTFDPHPSRLVALTSSGRRSIFGLFHAVELDSGKRTAFRFSQSRCAALS